jgi:hypothetical protein
MHVTSKECTETHIIVDVFIAIDVLNFVGGNETSCEIGGQ